MSTIDSAWMNYQSTSGVDPVLSQTKMKSQTMGSDSFYKLLAAEMNNQDPTAPVDNKEMILQLAQFSSIEATQQLNKDMGEYIDKASLSAATNLLGKEVVYINKDGSAYNSGVVSTVKKTDTGYSVTIGGVDVPLNKISSVTNPSVPATGTAQ